MYSVYLIYNPYKRGKHPRQHRGPALLHHPAPGSWLLAAGLTPVNQEVLLEAAS